VFNSVLGFHSSDGRATGWRLRCEVVLGGELGDSSRFRFLWGAQERRLPHCYLRHAPLQDFRNSHTVQGKQHLDHRSSSNRWGKHSDSCVLTEFVCSNIRFEKDWIRSNMSLYQNWVRVVYVIWWLAKFLEITSSWNNVSHWSFCLPQIALYCAAFIISSFMFVCLARSFL